MLAMVVLAGLGERLAERFLPLYLLAIGGTAWTVGALNGLTNLLGALYAYPGGWLSDRIGYRRALIVFNLVAMAGYAIAILVPTWWGVLLGAVFFIAWSAVSLPAIMSLVADLVPKDRRTMGVSLHSLVRRVPMALGPVLGGLLIARYGQVRGVQLAFGVALAVTAISVLLIRRFVRERPAAAAQKRTSPRPSFSPALRNLLVADILIRFTEQIPYAYVVVWAVKLHGISEVRFGVLTAIEMAVAVLCYLPVAHFADRLGKKPFVVATFCFFTAFPLILLFSTTFPALIAAFIVRGLKEFGEPTRKALIMDLAPEDAKAATFGAYYLIRDVIVSVAAFGAAWLWNVSPAVNFLTAAGFGVAGTLWFAGFGKDAGRAAEPPQSRQRPAVQT